MTDGAPLVYDAAARRMLAKCAVAGAADDAATKAHRALLAFVKTCLLDAAVRSEATPAEGFVLADVACGRGQDLPKLQHATRNTGKVCARVQCLDSSEPCLAAASTMVAKYMGPDVQARSRFDAVDAGADAEWPWPRGGAHILTCHLALHYWCDSEARVAAFFRNAAAATGPHAVMVLSFADGRWVVRAARDALAAAHHRHRDAGSGDTGSEDAVEVRLGACMYVKVPVAHLGRTVPSPWGAPYYFQLGDGARVAATEYLVHEGAVLRVAAAHGWAHVALSARADEAAQEFARRPRFHGFGLAMRALPLASASFGTAAAYRMVVLTKSPEARGHVVAALAGV